MATPTAARRWAGVTFARPEFAAWLCGVVLLLLLEITESPEPVATDFEVKDEVLNNEAGWAIITTPTRDITPAICSMRVNGSWIRT